MNAVPCLNCGKPRWEHFGKRLFCSKRSESMGFGPVYVPDEDEPE